MTAESPMRAIQAALYEVLSEDATLSGMVTGVHDDVPEDAALPYVVIGDFIEVPRNSQDRRGWETLATLDVWSNYRGNWEAADIAARLAALLDHQPLTLPGYHHVVTRFEFSQTLRDPDDPKLRHVPVRFRIVTEEEM